MDYRVGCRFLGVFMFDMADVANIAFWCFVLFGFIGICGAPVGGMLLALVAVFLVAGALYK